LAIDSVMPISYRLHGVLEFLDLVLEIVSSFDDAVEEKRDLLRAFTIYSIVSSYQVRPIWDLEK
jgi:hypothetical protein